MTKDQLIKFHKTVELRLIAELSETIDMIKSSVNLADSVLEERNYEEVIRYIKEMKNLIDFSQLEYDLAKLL